jgi:hypothetical protein
VTGAHNITQSLGGKWHGGYGVAPYPICQPEKRKDQCGLSLRDRADGSGLLAYCHKSGCDFRGILAAAGLAPKENARAGDTITTGLISLPHPVDTENG